MKVVLAAALFCLASAPVLARGATPAERIFAQYQSRERAFDPAVADMYCDNALIRNVRTYPDGQQRALEFPAPKYKELVRMAMPMAQAKGDYSTYSDVTYAPEGDGIRITATRYSVLKQYASPISLRIGPCNGGDWAILEELSQSRP